MRTKIDKTELPNCIKSMYERNLDYLDIVSVSMYGPKHYRVNFADGKSDDWKYHSNDWHYEVKYD